MSRAGGGIHYIWREWKMARCTKIIRLADFKRRVFPCAISAVSNEGTLDIRKQCSNPIYSPSAAKTCCNSASLIQNPVVLSSSRMGFTKEIAPIFFRLEMTPIRPITVMPNSVAFKRTRLSSINNRSASITYARTMASLSPGSRVCDNSKTMSLSDASWTIIHVAFAIGEIS